MSEINKQAGKYDAVISTQPQTPMFPPNPDTLTLFSSPLGDIQIDLRYSSRANFCFGGRLVPNRWPLLSFPSSLVL